MTSIWVRWMNLDTLMKQQMKHHQVFIWDETCFSSEIKHFLFHLRRRQKLIMPACGLVLWSVSRCLEPVVKHLPSFLTYYLMFLTWNYAMSLTNYAKETQLNEIQNGGWRAYILLITLISNEVYVVRILYGFSPRELCFIRDLNIKGEHNSQYSLPNTK